MIPESFIDELVRRSDIYELVSEYVRLSKKGGNYFGLCPFHGEKTASFSVNQEKQIYHCFGCNKGGGVINFVMEIENLNFVEALRFLADRANMKLPEDGEYDAGHREKRDRILSLNKEAAMFFHKTLTESDSGALAREYIQVRGISRGTMLRFGLGAAPDSWDALITEMAAKGYEKLDLLDAGLAVKNNDSGRVYDRFRNRLIFPIIDVRGSVIGFGGRVLDDSSPKYLNSPDTMVFNKSRNLFGLNIAKKTKQGRIILCEGYMDVLSLHQAGFDCAVASLGTALTGEHARLIERYASEVVIAYDSDQAGLSAAQRAIGIFEKTGLSVKVLRMEGVKDPDEFIKSRGRDAFKLLLDRSENHIDYRLMLIRMKYDLDKSEDKVAFLDEAVELIAGLDSAAQREVYGAKAAEEAGIAQDAVRLEVKRALSKRLKKEKRKQERRDLNPVSSLQPKDRGIRYENLHSARAEEGVVRLMLLDPAALSGAEGLRGEMFSSELLGRVFEELKARFSEGRAVGISALSGILSPEEMSHITMIVNKPESAENIDKALGDYIEIINAEHRKGSETEDLLEVSAKHRKTKGYGG